MAEIEGECGLSVGPAVVSIDAGGGAAQRTAAVGADREAGDIVFPLHLMITASSIDLDRGGFAFDARQRRKRIWRAPRARRARNRFSML